MAVTSVCIPTAVYVAAPWAVVPSFVIGTVQWPCSQHVQVTAGTDGVEGKSVSGEYGSLNTWIGTASFVLNVVATDDQNWAECVVRHRPLAVGDVGPRARASGGRG